MSESDPNLSAVIDTRNGVENARLGYTGGVGLCMQLKKHIGIGVGIQYSDKSYQTKTYELYYQQPDPAMPARIKVIYNYHYLDLPLTMNMAFGKRLQLVSSVGVAINFLLNANQRNILEYVNGKTERRDQSATFNFRKINFSPLVSLGMAYKLNKNAFLKMEPTFRYGLLKTVDAPISEHLWTAGVNVGFYHLL